MKTKVKIVIVLLNVYALPKVVVFLNSNKSQYKKSSNISDDDNLPKEIDFISAQDRFNLTPPHLLPETEKRNTIKYPKGTENCTTKTCLNYEKCNDFANFRIYIYKEPNRLYTDIYKKILYTIRNSNYYTANPKEACLFLISLDPLDRDRLSKNYEKEMDKQIQLLDLWNNGENHLIYNLYAGTWAAYYDDLNFNFGKAIIIQTSISYKFYRPDYDVAFPLFNPNLDEELERNTTEILAKQKVFDNSKKKYFLSFKGKRYLIGIGTKTRNALYHLNNNRDIVLLTTCIHPSTDKKLIEDDKRCAEDDALYNKYEKK